MPVERNWTVPEDQHHQPEIGLTEDGDLLLQPRVIRDDDPDSLFDAVAEVVSILRRVGGTIQIASQRAEVAPNLVVTESYIFAYNSFTPLVRRLDPQDDARLAHEQPAEGDGLSADEAEMHFPGGALEEAIEQAQAEQPADDQELEAAARVE